VLREQNADVRVVKTPLKRLAETSEQQVDLIVLTR
jgi:hypothetical protein